MNEFDLIERLTRGLPQNASTVCGPGDDCGVIDLGLPGRYLLLKTDAVVEGVHFTPEAEPERVGHKALARCLSDLAAMAGVPTHAVVTLGLPRDCDVGRIERLYAGLGALAQRYDVAIVGGETLRNPGPLLVSVAMLGWARRGSCPRRGDAREGDAVFVTGELGGALRSGRHLDFEPRLREAQWLVDHGEIHAMIDLSDGLAGDLRHVLRASQLGAELRAESIPVSRAARAPGRGTGREGALAAALGEGEDFELLFTTPSRLAVSLMDRWKERFPDLRLSCIGRMTGEPGLRLRDARGVSALEMHGYDHFQKP